MRIVRRCARCGRSLDYHEIWQSDHEFEPGTALIELDKEEVELFIAQGDDSAFKGNDLLYPIYSGLKGVL